MSVAIVTGASRGLGLALSRRLSSAGWTVAVDARDGDRLRDGVDGLAGVVRVPGDIADAGHRTELVAAARARGPIDLVVNNASLLGPSPQPPLADYPLGALRRVYEVNLLGPLGLIQAALPHLSPNAAILDITSDASVEAYAGWGGYGSSKAALDQLTAILAVEHPDLRIYAVDPGDMRTQMHQEAFPGEDISDRPQPETVVPGLLALIEGSLPSGRYRVADLGHPAADLGQPAAGGPIPPGDGA
jgi:NAD(P)-dependent dehydrogenase (short-subunit alcohol dehydrogenase family)